MTHTLLDTHICAAILSLNSEHTERFPIPTLRSSNILQLKDLKYDIQSGENCKSLVICSERKQGSACHL